MTTTPPSPAPTFSLKDTEGNTHTLDQYRGKWVVLYFYPKDDTPGCTTEACSFRDSHELLLAKEAVVLGVSRDDAASHEKFMNKYSLPFPLLSDPDHAVMDAYGAWGKKMFGKEGVLRKTFIINPEGDVVKIYGRVTPIGHAEHVLQTLADLQR